MTPTREKLVRGSTWLAVGLGIVALSAGLFTASACTSTDGPPPGPPPVITLMDAGSDGIVTAKRTDAGAELGCCTFSVSVKYEIDGNDFVRHGTIEWDDARTSKTRFQYTPTNLNDEIRLAADAGPGRASRSLELTATVPGVLVDGSKDIARGFVVRLHAAGGGVSAPVPGTIAIR